MEPQKPGSSPGLGPDVVERQRVAEERAVQRVCSWTVQNKMRGGIRVGAWKGKSQFHSEEGQVSKRVSRMSKFA